MIACYTDDGTVKKLAAKVGVEDRFRETDIPNAFQVTETKIGRQWFFVCRFSNWSDREDDGWIAHVCDSPETANLLRAALAGNLLTRESR